MRKLLAIVMIVLFALPSFSTAENEDNMILGKWSCYFDILKLPEKIQNVYDYSLIAYDLYLFDNGSVYMTQVITPKKTGTPQFSYGAITGIWIGSRDDMTIKVGDQTYKATISDDGYLLLFMTKTLPMAFVHVDTTDKMNELALN